MNPDRLLQQFDRISEAPKAIPHLRRFILDLAVRGKLVEQDPKDEPAGELLKRIQKEKERLVKTGKIKEKGIAPQVEEGAQPSGIPVALAWTFLGEVSQYGQSDKVDSNKAISEITWVLDLEDVEKDTSRLIDRVLSSSRPFQSAKTRFKKGDVLFGKLRPYLNKVLVADIDGVCTTEIVPVRGLCGIAPEYIKLVLKSPLTMERVNQLMYGMKMPRLGTNDAVALKFPLPPLAEQHRIVAKVDELMALCDQLEATKTEREQNRDRLVAASLHLLNEPADTSEAFHDNTRFFFNHLPRVTTCPAHIKQLRQTILNLAVRGKLVEQDPKDEPARELLKRIKAEKERLVKEGEVRRLEKYDPVLADEIPFALPTGWEVMRMGWLAQKLGAGSTPLGGKSVYQAVGVPFLRSQNVHNNGLRLDDVAFITRAIHNRMSGTHVQQQDLLLNITGASIGRCTLVPSTFLEGNVSQHVAIIRLFFPAIREFIQLSLISPFFQKVIDDVQVGVSREGLSMQRLRLFPMLLPPLAEQHRIVAKVDELMALCNQLEAQLTTTDAERRSLLEAVLHEAVEPAPVRESR